MQEDAHCALGEEAYDHVALYALDSMQAGEAARFEEHLGSCAACREELVRLKPVVADLLLAGPQSDPPPGLKQRVLQRARQRRLALRPVARRIWHESDEPGVEISQLRSDVASGRHTLLIRMAAGASIRTHRHPGTEECFVVDGDLHDGDLVLGAGDYVCHDGGSVHSISTRNGCLLYVTTASPDRQVPSHPGG